MEKADLFSLRAQLSDVYRDYRNTCLSKKYYEHRLKSVRNINLIYEIVLAFGTSGTVGAWAIWKEPGGNTVWIGIGVTVALLTIIKPLVKLGDEIERLSFLATKYAAMQIDFQLLIFDIKATRQLNDELRRFYKEICTKMQELSAKEDSAPNQKLLRNLCEEVNREIPPKSLWSPD